jgi:hypothetical protein
MAEGPSLRLLASGEAAPITQRNVETHDWNSNWNYTKGDPVGVMLDFGTGTGFLRTAIASAFTTTADLAWYWHPKTLASQGWW